MALTPEQNEAKQEFGSFPIGDEIPDSESKKVWHQVGDHPAWVRDEACPTQVGEGDIGVE